MKTIEKNSKQKQKRWTTDEENYLKNWYGIKTIPEISQKLKRSVGSVQRKIERMKLSRSTEFAGDLTASALAKLLKVDVHTVRLWIKKYELPHQRRIVGYEREYIFIEPSSFWEWAKTHQSLINFCKIEKNAIPPEPEWLDEARTRDYYSIPQKNHQLWTDEEDKLIWHLFYERGYSQEKIGKEVKRSKRAVQKRLSELRKQKRKIDAG
jgi:hypothetical protein